MAAPPPGQPFHNTVPGFPPMPPMGPPLIPVPPPQVLMMPLGVPQQVPPVMTTPLLQSVAPTNDHLILKTFQKPPSVGEMKVATTVFVGNITEKATDSLVRQILLRCGYIVGWKRVQNATGKLQAFGFCEYADPECTLRALRLLNGFQLGDKELVIKVDTKNKKELLKYLMKKKRLKANEEVNDIILEREVDKIVLKGEADALEEDIDEETKSEDDKVMIAIRSLVRENIDILSGTKTSDDFRREKDVHESLIAMAKQAGQIDVDSSLEDVQMEDGMKTLVSDEIKKFRLSYQNYEEQQIEMRIKRQQAKLEEKEKKKDEKPGRKRSRSRSPKKRGRSKSPKKSHLIPRTKSQERRDRDKEREQRRKEEKLRLAKEEEEYEQKQLERKRTEKERLFKERLRQWEAREKRKASDYDYERDDDEAKRSKSEKDKKRLMEFLEHYDDDKSDNRYYKGNDWLRRREDRNMEIESDAVDRKREEDELEALRLEVMERQIREREEQERKKLEAEKMEGMQNNHGNGHNEEEEVDMIPPDIDESVPLAKQDNKPSFPPIKIQLAPPVDGPGGTEIKSNPNELTSTDILDDDQKKSTKLSISLKSTAAARGPLPEVFGGEEEQEDVKPKKKVYSLMSNPNSAHITTAMVLAPSEEKMNIEDRKKLVQSLVNSIPSRREELFNWDLKWDYIDKTLMDKRVAPWIDKKIIEYIGEPEPTLTEFVCNKLSEHVSAEAILDDIAVVLDDEAEVFILKLWRLLIYETEAKHLGIAKNY